MYREVEALGNIVASHSCTEGICFGNDAAVVYNISPPFNDSIQSPAGNRQGFTFFTLALFYAFIGPDKSSIKHPTAQVCDATKASFLYFSRVNKSLTHMNMWGKLYNDYNNFIAATTITFMKKHALFACPGASLLYCIVTNGACACNQKRVKNVSLVSGSFPL